MSKLAVDACTALEGFLNGVGDGNARRYFSDVDKDAKGGIRKAINRKEVLRTLSELKAAFAKTTTTTTLR